MEKRYDKLKCDVTETVPGNIAGSSYNSQTDNQTLSQMSLIGPIVITTIKSTNLICATTQICNSVPIAGPSSVVTTFAEASTSGNLNNPAITTAYFPDQSSSFSLDLTDESICNPANAENVNASFSLQPPFGFCKRSTSNVAKGI